MIIPFAYAKHRVAHSEKFATFVPLHTDAKGEEFFSLVTVHGHRIGDEFSLIPDVFLHTQMYLEETNQIDEFAQFIRENRLRLIEFQGDVYFASSRNKNFALPRLTITTGSYRTDRMLYYFIANELSIADCGMNTNIGFHVPKILLHPFTSKFKSTTIVPTPL